MCTRTKSENEFLMYAGSITLVFLCVEVTDLSQDKLHDCGPLGLRFEKLTAGMRPACIPGDRPSRPALIEQRTSAWKQLGFLGPPECIDVKVLSERRRRAAKASFANGRSAT
jgi:hypothetical protein